MGKIGKTIGKIPLVGDLAKAVVKKVRYSNDKFQGSKNYWEERYAAGGNSGYGSYNKFAEYKADVINKFVADNGIQTLVEFGCGDGNQLTLAKYPHYIGIDVSSTVIDQCLKLFAGDDSKEFVVYNSTDYDNSHRAELSMSLDVIYHLIEEEVYNNYMKDLFAAGEKYVIIYSSNQYKEQTFHEKHRKFTDWIEKNAADWTLIKQMDNPYKNMKGEEHSHADFYIYEKKAN